MIKKENIFFSKNVHSCRLSLFNGHFSYTSIINTFVLVINERNFIWILVMVRNDYVNGYKK